MARKVEEMTDEELDNIISSGKASTNPEEMSDEELDAIITGQENAQMGDQPLPSTLESKYLEPHVYPMLEKVAGALGTIQKPLQYAAAPFVQAATATSNLIQGKPQEEAINPIMNPVDYANKYGSTETFMKTLPVGNQPLSEMIPESEAGNYLQREFPKASELARGITPNMAAAGLTDIGLGSKAYPQIAKTYLEGARRSANYAEGKLPSFMNREQLADQIISGNATDKTLLNELKSSGKFNETREFFLKNPELNRVGSTRAYDALTGKATQYLDEYGRKKYRKEGGLIADINKGQSEFIESIPVNKRTTVSSTDMQADALEALNDMTLTNRSRAAAEKIILDEIPVFAEEALNKNPVDYADQLRKQSNRLLDESSLSASGMERSSGESAAIAIEKASRKAMDRSINLMDDAASESYRSNQQRLSNALRMKDLYSRANVSEKGVRVPTGSMERGVIRGAMDLKATHIDPFLLDIAQNRAAGNTPISNISKSVSQSPVGTSMVQSIPTQQEQYMMRRGLVENLADFQVPRSTSSILSNKDMVFAKVAQATNDPAILEGLKESLSKHPDKLKSILPVLVMQFPQLFEADKYNRVDGRIFHPDPMMQEKLRNDAKNEVESRRDKMTNTERIMILRGLNMDGSLPESIQ